METIIIGTSHLWILNTHHYKHTQYCYIPDGVHCSDGLRISDVLRKENSQSTEKPALELSCILLFRQRKEVLSYILHTINYTHKQFFKIRRSYNSCKVKHIIV